MNEIANRNNIVNYFYNNLHNALLSSESTPERIILQIGERATITKTKDSMIFDMKLSGSSIEIINDIYHQNTYEDRKEFYAYAKVMEYNRSTGSFDMVSCSDNDKWLTVQTSMVVQNRNGNFSMSPDAVTTLSTALNSHYYKIPDSEESHFQRGTTNDGIVLDLDVCLKLHNVIKRIEGVGEVVKANDNLYVNLIFEQNLSEDA